MADNYRLQFSSFLVARCGQVAKFQIMGCEQKGWGPPLGHFLTLPLLFISISADLNGAVIAMAAVRGRKAGKFNLSLGKMPCSHSIMEGEANCHWELINLRPEAHFISRGPRNTQMIQCQIRCFLLSVH